jgi:hypothetical protein
MPTLHKDLRGKLEKAVLAAREEATKGAMAALLALGVGDGKKPGHLDKDGEALRRRLRARGRQAGDALRSDDSQETRRLVQECAYEHWHRMLFARYLAENELLRHPEWNVAVSLEECEELAREEGLDRWELAARLAQHMLPEVFRPDDPVLQLRLPTEVRNKLTAILNQLPDEVFTASDSLGWTYQFWQTDQKEIVNKSGNKIGAEELPSVTQLFTEDYMVDFLLDNTLGAWHAGKVLAANPGLAESAGNEEELRKAVALPGCTWDYLRFIKREDGHWAPAAGTFDGWPKTAAELKCLDPCMGSGHFVVAMFERLVTLRLAEEKLDEAAAVAAVIADNLFGLEIDPRCTQIGAFNLALAAWRRVGHCKLPAMNLACSGLAPNAKREDWLKLTEGAPHLRFQIGALYDLFGKAPVLGSLINPRADKAATYGEALHELQPLLDKALAREAKDDIAHEMAVTAHGLAKAAEILAGQFTLVATNVPYLGRPNQDEILKDYCDQAHREARSDLATCFLERSLSFSAPGASVALVSPQSWLFQPGYKKLRANLLAKESWEFLARLGPRAFETISGEQVNVCLLALSRSQAKETHSFSGVDVTDRPSANEKKTGLHGDPIATVAQAAQLRNPDTRIALEALESDQLLAKHAVCIQGLATSDDPQFTCFFWEFPQLNNGWEGLMGTVETTRLSGGRERLIHWDNGAGRYYRHAQALKSEGRLGGWKSGTEARGKMGVLVSQMSTMPVTLYSGEFYDHNASVIVPHDVSQLAAIWAFSSSSEFVEEVRKLDRSLKPSNNVFVKVPFDLAHWQKVAAEKYPHGLPKPYSSDPTQWLFNGHPAGADQPLHVAVARLLGYQWPRQTGSSFPDCPALGPDGLESFSDDDGIVCLTSLRGEANATDRLREILRAALETFDERQLIAQAGRKGSKSPTLEDWLRDEFFEQHADLFHNRLFLWHLWDGRKDGFHALVNYHRLGAPNGAGRRTLEALTHGYLGDWITRQRAAVVKGESGADDRLAAALELHGLLENILAGEPPYDLFIRWKPLHQQPIGWEPDLNDGVRLNARPFLATDLSRGKKGAGLFRSKVNLKWEKNKGKEPVRPKENFPWFWNWDEKTENFAGGREFDGNRWNNLHYTTAFKQVARERKVISS